jgi:hypothetical protein
VFPADLVIDFTDAVDSRRYYTVPNLVALKSGILSVAETIVFRNGAAAFRAIEWLGRVDEYVRYSRPAIKHHPAVDAVRDVTKVTVEDVPVPNRKLGARL